MFQLQQILKAGVTVCEENADSVHPSLAEESDEGEKVEIVPESDSQPGDIIIPLSSGNDIEDDFDADT